MLSNKFGHHFFIVREYTMKTEYQGRGTPHWHIAAWVVCFGHISLLAGRTNKYVSKDHDAVDVGLGEYRQRRHSPMACSVSFTLQG